MDKETIDVFIECNNGIKCQLRVNKNEYLSYFKDGSDLSKTVGLPKDYSQDVCLVLPPTRIRSIEEAVQGTLSHDLWK